MFLDVLGAELGYHAGQVDGRTLLVQLGCAHLYLLLVFFAVVTVQVNFVEQVFADVFPFKGLEAQLQHGVHDLSELLFDQLHHAGQVLLAGLSQLWQSLVLVEEEQDLGGYLRDFLLEGLHVASPSQVGDAHQCGRDQGLVFLSAYVSVYDFVEHRQEFVLARNGFLAGCSHHAAQRLETLLFVADLRGLGQGGDQRSDQVVDLVLDFVFVQILRIRVNRLEYPVFDLLCVVIADQCVHQLRQNFLVLFAHLRLTLLAEIP